MFKFTSEDILASSNPAWKRAVRDAISVAEVVKAKPAHVTGQPNKTEAAFARKLDGMKAAGVVLEYWFERLKFRLNDTGDGRACWYTVDYVILNADGSRTFAEVKGGHVWGDSVIKWKWAAHEYASWGRWEMWQRVKGEFKLIRSSVVPAAAGREAK